MGDSLKVFTDIAGQTGKLPTAILIALVCIAMGLALKALRAFPNKYIPLFTMPFASIAYAFLGNVSQIDPSQSYPRVILAFYGILIGFTAWAAHKFVLKKLEKFLPAGFLPAEDFDTNPPFAKTDDSNPKPIDKP